MFREIEFLIRYAVPGYIMLFPLIFMVFFISPEAGEFIGLVFLGIGFPVGYFLHQLHLFIFDKYGWPFQREGVKVGDGGLGKIIELSEKEGKKLTPTQALMVWDYFICSDRVSEGLREQNDCMSDSIHSLKTVSFACILGAVGMITGVLYLSAYNVLAQPQTMTLAMLFLVYLLLGAALYKKSNMMLTPLMNFEEFIIEKHWGAMKELLTIAEDID